MKWQHFQLSTKLKCKIRISDISWFPIMDFPYQLFSLVFEFPIDFNLFQFWCSYRHNKFNWIIISFIRWHSLIIFKQKKSLNCFVSYFYGIEFILSSQWMFNIQHSICIFCLLNFHLFSSSPAIEWESF